MLCRGLHKVFFVILPFIAMLCYILQGRFDRSAVLCHLYLLFLLLWVIVVKMLRVSQKLIDAHLQQQIKSLVQVFGEQFAVSHSPCFVSLYARYLMLMYIVQKTVTIPQPWAYALLMTYMYKLTAVVAGSSCLVYCINENFDG